VKSGDAQNWEKTGLFPGGTENRPKSSKEMARAGGFVRAGQNRVAARVARKTAGAGATG